MNDILIALIPTLIMIYMFYAHFWHEKQMEKEYDRGKQDGKKEAIEKIFEVSIINEIKKE